jgi:hypothetical protein
VSSPIRSWRPIRKDAFMDADPTISGMLERILTDDFARWKR